jgi:hypothetical protein
MPLPPMNIKELMNEERDFLASWADIVGVIHTMEKKVSKLHDVVIGDKEFGQEGILQRQKNIEQDLEEIKRDLSSIKRIDTEQIKKDLDDLKAYKHKLVGIAVATGGFIAIIWELAKTVLKK